MRPQCPQPPAAADISELWHEYEAGETPEANLVKDFDKLEMIIQAGPATLSDCIWL
jgi:5'-deoxynucleotidase YfbR-like HD superfamily hydrolase